MKHGTVLLCPIIMAVFLGACSNFFHELIPPDGDRITSFTVPGQLRAAIIGDDAVMVTLEEGANVRSLLPSITASPRARVLPITFNYLQRAFPGEDILSAAVELYKSDNPAAYIENLVRKNKDFRVPALDIPIDFFAPVDIYVIAARGNMRRYTVYVSVENENNTPGGGVEWPRLLGMGFSKANNPGLRADALCWIMEDNRTVSATIRYMPDSGFSFALVPTFVIWGDRVELDGNEITSDTSVIQFNAEQEKQTGTLTLWRGNNSVNYTLNLSFTEDMGDNGPILENLRFAKYDNPELVIDAVCNIYENSLSVSARAFYPVEMANLSFALVPSFEILGDRLEIDGAEVRSGDETSFIQFNKSLGAQNKVLTVYRNGRSKDYALTITFEEDPDTVRSITDFRFVKQDNSGVAANAVAAIVNTDNTGAITVQVFYSGAKPLNLVPRFVSPGTVSVSGASQASGMSSQDFSSPLEYRVVSRNGQFVRTYTVRVEFLSLTDAAPRITSFRFSQTLNPALTQDSDGVIQDDTAIITINAYYGGAFPPEQVTPEFSAEGIVQVMGSVQISTASPQDFNRPVRYTVVHPLNSLLKRDYWVYTTMVQDSASHAIITRFSFDPDDNQGLRDELIARIDQATGKISVFAPIGSGLTARTMYPRFTAAGTVSVSGSAQISGTSGQTFGSPVVYTVVSTNGLNRRDYTVEVRELTSTMYVNQNAVGSGDGTSWENAFRYLQTACEAASQFPEDVPKEIWIAKGTYTPADIDDYFRLTPNTSYIGGFAGHETSKSQRNVAANAVTVSGSLGGGAHARRLFAAVSELDGDLSFENLRMTGVRGQQGAGINAPLNSSSEISITDCNFNDIQASGTGGAVYVKGGSAVISDSTFSACNNGAVYVQGAAARITDIEFSNCDNGSTLWLDCSDDTEITRVNVTDSSGTAFYLSGNGNKTLETLNVIRGGQCLNVQNTTGYVRITGLVMRDINGAGISMNGVTGVKYFNGITARNTNGNAIDSSASSGSFTLTGSSTFDNTGIISVSNGTGAVSVSSTEIKNSKGSSALSVTANGNTVIDALAIDNVLNGRGIYITNNGSAAISNTVIKNCVTTGNGGGISISGSGSADISATTITNCKANQYGGGLYLANSGNAYLSNITIDTVTLAASSGYGGGIYRTGGSLKVDGNSIIKNITGGDGTGIYHAASVKLEVTDLELQNISGNGIYSTGSGVREFSDITAANIGGDWGIYSDSMTSGSFTLIDSKFISCGVYCGASNAVPIKVTDTDIYNASGPNGLYASTGNAAITVEWVTIDGVPNGRGIYTSSNNTVKISNSTIKNCVITENGGGMYIEGSGSANISDVTITVCRAYSGGGMYLVCSGNVSISNSIIDTTTLIAIQYNDDDDDYYNYFNRGGGIYRSGGNMSVINSVIKNITGRGNNSCSGIYYNASANIEVSGLDLQNITGYGIICSGSGTRYFSSVTTSGIGGGWGIYSGSMASGSFTVTGNSKFTSCGLYCNAGSTNVVPVQVTDTDIRNTSGNQGLYALTAGKVTIDNVTIDGVPNGNGIYVAYSNMVEVSNSNIRNCQNNSVNSANGGGINLYCANIVEISSTTIENVTAREGGGIYSYYNNYDDTFCRLTINGCAIKNARVRLAGGGLCVSGPHTLTINDTTFELCLSDEYEGVIRTSANRPNSTITNSRFINCTANATSGLIFKAENLGIIRGCTFTHDAYLPYMGEPILETSGALLGLGGNFENCTFNNLRSNKSGEAYIFEKNYVNDRTITLRNCTFNFQSGSAGLCLYSGYGTKLLMDGVTINDNGGQRPLIYLSTYAANGGYFNFKPNNIYNGTLLNTAAAITGLSSSGVLKLTDGATPVIVP